MTLLSSPFRFAAASGGIHRSTATRRAAPMRFSPGKGKQQGTKGLLLCRSGPLDMPVLRPEDLVEPTGQGVEEIEAIRDALLRDSLQPIWLALQEIVATGGNLFRCQCFHVGVLSGPLLIVAGLCKLRTVAPNLFLDIVLGYIFFKLSVLAAHLKRNGRANNICARIQFVLMLVLFLKCNNPTKDFYYRFTEFFWAITLQVYASKALCEFIGWEYPRQEMEGLFKAIFSKKW